MTARDINRQMHTHRETCRQRQREGESLIDLARFALLCLWSVHGTARATREISMTLDKVH